MKDSNWQPIETAPKDGAVILACAAKGEVVAVSWGLAEKYGWQLYGEDIADADFPWLCFDPECGGLNAYMADKLTHWMPLPAPPEGA